MARRSLRGRGTFRLRRGIAGRASQVVRLAFELGVVLVEFLDAQGLIPANVGKSLDGVAYRPPNFQGFNGSRFAKPDVLFEW